MLIDVVLNPAEIALLPKRDLSATTCVVFDVLRATSSMITGLANGAAEIHPVTSIEAAQELKVQVPDAVLGGERNGDRINGFEIGNSPLEYVNLAGKKIITTTTNGTVALKACEGAEEVIIGAILNISAVATELRRQGPAEVVLVCAGTFDDFALEDAVAAGMLIEELGTDNLTDSARAALAIARAFPNPLDALKVAKNGRVLADKGRGEDVEWCAQRSRFNVVGSMARSVIKLVSPDSHA
jgi:2-phosphosulfolactate phosphatase